MKTSDVGAGGSIHNVSCHDWIVTLTINVGDCNAFTECHEQDDSTSGVVVKQLEHVHAALKV